MATPINEKESRRKLLSLARGYGAEADLLKIFKRYDDLLKGCKTDEERKAVATMGCLEVHNFFGGDGGLTVGGKIIKEDPYGRDLVPAPENESKNGQ
jgi:hypothetical protein